MLTISTKTISAVAKISIPNFDLFAIVVVVAGGMMNVQFVGSSHCSV